MNGVAKCMMVKCLDCKNDAIKVGYICRNSRKGIEEKEESKGKQMKLSLKLIRKMQEK